MLANNLTWEHTWRMVTVMAACKRMQNKWQVHKLEGGMSRSNVEALSELCYPFLKGGNSILIATIASGPFPKNKYWSLE